MAAEKMPETGWPRGEHPTGEALVVTADGTAEPARLIPRNEPSDAHQLMIQTAFIADAAAGATAAATSLELACPAGTATAWATLGFDSLVDRRVVVSFYFEFLEGSGGEALLSVLLNNKVQHVIREQFASGAGARWSGLITEKSDLFIKGPGSRELAFRLDTLECASSAVRITTVVHAHMG